MKIQTNMPLVVLTYPGHFLSTVLTIRSYLEYHVPTEVIVVADDLSPYAWDTYLTDCQKAYTCTVIPVSLILITKEFNNGWIRQQIAKLHLDFAIKSAQWFFTDGDIVFLHKVDPTHTPYSIPNFNEISNQQHNYIQTLLRIPNPGIYVNDQLVCVSDPPFRTMTEQTLKKLRQHAGDRITQTGVGMSEWELIENFRQHVLGEQLNLVRYAPHNIANPNKKLDFFEYQFLTHYGTDRELGQEYFTNQNINVPDSIWQELSKISK